MFCSNFSNPSASALYSSVQSRSQSNRLITVLETAHWRRVLALLWIYRSLNYEMHLCMAYNNLSVVCVNLEFKVHGSKISV